MNIQPTNEYAERSYSQVSFSTLGSVDNTQAMSNVQSNRYSIGPKPLNQ